MHIDWVKQIPPRYQYDPHLFGHDQSEGRGPGAILIGLTNLYGGHYRLEGNTLTFGLKPLQPEANYYHGAGTHTVYEGLFDQTKTWNHGRLTGNIRVYGGNVRINTLVKQKIKEFLKTDGPKWHRVTPHTKQDRHNEGVIEGFRDWCSKSVAKKEKDPALGEHTNHYELNVVAIILDQQLHLTYLPGYFSDFVALTDFSERNERWFEASWVGGTTVTVSKEGLVVDMPSHSIELGLGLTFEMKQEATKKLHHLLR